MLLQENTLQLGGGLIFYLITSFRQFQVEFPDMVHPWDKLAPVVNYSVVFINYIQEFYFDITWI